MPIRARLALVSASLTFAILATFALVVGGLAADRLDEDFDERSRASAGGLQASFELLEIGGKLVCRPDLDDFAAAEPTRIRVSVGSRTICEDVGARRAREAGRALDDGSYELVRRRFEITGDNLLELTDATLVVIESGAPAVIEYARDRSDVSKSIARLWLFLGLGTILGTLFAFMAGRAVARRAMAPVRGLTRAAAEIERTGDPRRRIALPPRDDEIADLARTLDAMLVSLGQARAEQEQLVDRQRAFVADASHELRTPLTSVIANVELLADTLDADRGEVASAALRSARRMSRLVDDLLLLARADARRARLHESLDLATVAREAIDELTPSAGRHAIVADLAPATVDGAHDDLHRVVVNLIANAIRHTPGGTTIRITVAAEGPRARLVVQDDGPGIPAPLRGQVFERFVTEAGDRGTGTGLGLAIVKAVADAHGGSVVLEDAQPGARFVVTLPLAETAN